MDLAMQGAMPDPRRAPRGFLEHLYAAAVQRALPLHTLGEVLPPPPKGRTLVLGAGKAGGSMAQAVEALWPADAPLSGLVVTRYDHIPPRPDGPARSASRSSRPRIRCPTRPGLQAARAHPGADARAHRRRPGAVPDLGRRLGAADAAGRRPDAGRQAAHQQASCSSRGADIGEMNCVRKHLSRIKGGRLAAACAPARVVTLTISDVPGDDPSVIASGPTVPDATTCADALAILRALRHRGARRDAAPAGAAARSRRPSPATPSSPATPCT